MHSRLQNGAYSSAQKYSVHSESEYDFTNDFNIASQNTTNQQVREGNALLRKIELDMTEDEEGYQYADDDFNADSAKIEKPPEDSL